MDREILLDIQSRIKAMEERQSVPHAVKAALEEAKKYMMENYNITWLNDSIEDDIYEVLIGMIEQCLLKALGQ